MTPRLDEIKARVAAATPGPWEYYSGYEEHRNYPVAMLADGHSYCGVFPSEVREVPLEMQIPNGDLIANAPEDLAWLIAELEAYKKAKAENDERFMLERDKARADLDDARRQLIERQTEYCFKIENDWREPQGARLGRG